MEEILVLLVVNPKEPGVPGITEGPPLALNGLRFSVGSTAEDFGEDLQKAEVLFSWGAKRETLEQILPRATNLKWMHSRSAGLDSLLFPALIESPLPLTNGRGVFSQSLGEFVMAAVLFFAKDFRRMIRNQEAGRWEQFDVIEVSGQTIGIVGYGDIGRAIAQRARAFGLNVVAVRRDPEKSRGDEFVSKVVPFARRREILPECDYVVAAAPLTPESKGLISDAEFAAMKPSAIIMNVGRGPVIDEAAMIRALETKRIAGAALDVFDVEPLPAGHPFYKMQNVLLSPHCSDNTATWLKDAVTFFLENVERFRKGEPLKNVVDKKRGY